MSQRTFISVFAFGSFTWAILTVLAAGSLMTRDAGAAALFAGTAPTIDGTVSPGEWDFADVEFDSGARPNGASNLGAWDLSGAKGRFGWDATNLYGLIEAYPNTGTPSPGENANGPFDQMNWEVYINSAGFPAAAFLDTTSGDNNHPGSTAAFGTTDPVDTGNPLARMVIEFSMPINTIIDSTGGTLPNPHTFDPSTDFLEYRLRTTDPDSAGGFDTRDQTMGWLVEPLETGGGYRRLNFVPEPACLTLIGLGGLAAAAFLRRRR